MTPSLTYRLLTPVIKATGHKEVYSFGREDLERWMREHANERSSSVPPWVYRRCAVQEEQITKATCYRVKAGQRGGVQASSAEACSQAQPVGTPRGLSEPAPLPFVRPPSRQSPLHILFLHGGGFIFEARGVHWQAAVALTERLGAEVWFLAYPLLPEHRIEDALEATISTYASMLAQDIETEQIAIVGDSAGATLALMLAHSLAHSQTQNHAQSPARSLAHSLTAAVDAPALPQPGRMALLSPAQMVAPTPEIRAQMEAIEPRDIMLSTAIMDALHALTAPSAADPPWYERCLEGDYTGFPPLAAFYGTAEIFHALAPTLVEHAAAANVPLELHFGEGLCHVYPYVPLAPDCRAGFEQLVSFLSAASQ